VIKRAIGLDWFDLLVHVGITFAIGVIVLEMANGPDADCAVAVVVAASLGLLAWRRSRALKRRESLDSVSDSDRVAELENRVYQLEQGQSRMMELEERLDFAERMLVQQRDREAPRLGTGGPER
jgi:uncharacterized protein HemX